MGIKEDMPLLARHEGVWEGSYTYFNAANEKIDEHKSRPEKECLRFDVSLFRRAGHHPA